jgi:HNH endonuclease
VSKRKSRRSYADRLWSAYIKRSRECAKCGSRSNFLEAAHIIPRRALSVRWNPLNGIPLCAATCHRDFDNPASAESRRALIHGWIGATVYEELLRLAARPWNKDYDEPIAELNRLLKAKSERRAA